MLKSYKADLHLHSVLSPCGDLEMSPVNIIAKSKELGLQIIGLTDHNCTQQCVVTQKLGAENDIFVLCGAEVTTKEEIHCLSFFGKEEELNAFQEFLDLHLPKIQNDEDRFGYQLIVDEEENIIGEKEYLLISALDVGIEELYHVVHNLNGLFIPAHVNKPANSLMSQLGFIPPDLKADGLEISRHITKEAFLKKNAYLKKFSFIQDSDAHYIHLMGETYCFFHIENRTFEEICKAFKKEDGRFIELIEEQSGV